MDDSSAWRNSGRLVIWKPWTMWWCSLRVNDNTSLDTLTQFSCKNNERVKVGYHIYRGSQNYAWYLGSLTTSGTWSWLFLMISAARSRTCSFERVTNGKEWKNNLRKTSQMHLFAVNPLIFGPSLLDKYIYSKMFLESRLISYPLWERVLVAHEGPRSRIH